MDSIIYREADIHDAPELAKIESGIFTFPHTENQLYSALNDEHYIYYIAQKGDKIVGYIGIQVIEDECYIQNIAVEQNCRGNDISTHLMTWLILKSKELRLSFISLEVRASNTIAISLYKKFNFEIISVLHGYYD